jgi:hypothetical protein
VSTRTKAPKRQPFAHAADLPAAYAELAGVLREINEQPHMIRHDPREAPIVSPYALLHEADAMIATANRLRAAARRVLIAQNGPLLHVPRNGGTPQTRMPTRRSAS